MKDKENDILDKVARHDGMTVPPGFFEEFSKSVISELPENPEAEHPRMAPAPQTFWGRVRPYVYMAAMFAGIWCMFKMFTMMSNTSTDLTIDNNKILTEALSDDNFIYDHFLDDINQREILDDLYDDSIDVEEFDIELSAEMPEEEVR